jgi:ribosomal protein S18 acetylase RimI-like enzyme
VNPSALHIVNEALNEGSMALYAREGYSCDFIEDWMQRDLREPLPPVAQGYDAAAWTPENAGRFFEAYVQAFKDRRRPGSPVPSQVEWINDYIEDPDFRSDLSMMAYIDGKPVGFITVGLMRIAQLDQTVGWISQVGVGPAWRGRGVAAGLLAAVMESFKREGLTAAGLHVNADNPGARRLYERLGFKLAGQRGKYSKSNVR